MAKAAHTARPMDSVADLIGGDRTVAYKPVLGHALGDAVSGILLSQFWFWTNNDASIQRDGWFWKTQEDIEAETAITRREQETARKRLRAAGVLLEEKRGVPARLWFKVDKDALYALLREYAEAKFPGWRKAPNKDGAIGQTRMAESAKQESRKAPNKDGGKHQSTSEKTASDDQKKTASESSLALFTEQTDPIQRVGVIHPKFVADMERRRAARKEIE